MNKLEKRDQHLPHKTLCLPSGGRLNHVCFVIPDARHFMNHLHKMKQVAESARKLIKLPLGAREDLQLWLKFLKYTARGISINLLVFCKPILQYLSYASPWGIGGLSPTTLLGWRHELTELEQVSTYNLVEPKTPRKRPWPFGHRLNTRLTHWAS